MYRLRIPLGESLALADVSTRPFPFTLEAVDDPLRLSLPPLFDSAGGILPSPATLRVMATLYLQAELEQAGIIPAAEVLAQSRAALPLASLEAARKLEDFARRSRDWYDRRSRDLLFARTFGFGQAAAAQPADTANRNFQQHFASLCATLMNYENDLRWSPAAGPAREALLRHAAVSLLTNLGARQFGNTILAARSIQDQLQRAIDLLSDPAIGGVFMARGMWDLLRKLYGDQTPDLARLVRRGQTGQKILNWLSTLAPLWESGDEPLRLSADSPVFLWAGAWLEASGLAPRPQGFPLSGARRR